MWFRCGPWPRLWPLVCCILVTILVITKLSSDSTVLPQLARAMEVYSDHDSLDDIANVTLGVRSVSCVLARLESSH
jgi:hypothetical protein